MPATAIPLADLVDLMRSRHGRPGVEAHRHLRARPQGHRDRVAGLRKQVIRDELVERGHAAVGQIRKHNAPVQARRGTHGLDILGVLGKERSQGTRHVRIRRNRGQ